MGRPAGTYIPRQSGATSGTLYLELATSYFHKVKRTKQRGKRRKNEVKEVQTHRIKAPLHHSPQQAHRDDSCCDDKQGVENSYQISFYHALRGYEDGKTGKNRIDVIWKDRSCRAMVAFPYHIGPTSHPYPYSKPFRIRRKPFTYRH